jgi:hypothetical protein
MEFRLSEETELYRSELARWTDKRPIRPGFHLDEWRDFARRDLLSTQSGESPIETAVALMEVTRKGLPGPLLDARLIGDSDDASRELLAAGNVVTAAWRPGAGPSAVGWGAVSDVTVDPSGAVLARGPLPRMVTAYLHPHGWWAGPVPAFPVEPRYARQWLLSGAVLSGLATGSLELATRYVGQRVQFGRPIGSFQAVQFPLAECKAATEGLRLMVLDAAWRAAGGRDDADIAAALLCVAADRVSRFVSDCCQQAHGASGLANESGLNELTWAERWVRHGMDVAAARALVNRRRVMDTSPPPSLVMQGFASSAGAPSTDAGLKSSR